mmetsp:Transcript_10189/g.16691  ORF Transcript_10189/g.16691 Transcript_10189/m.16691 type:complete len:522 (+) Transcript_10189:160-1725(+)|eukprot:CAMPEP_0184653152 /NCGR_PEP_ID=MMETSP0308-20130426/10900_1 /TAXON_ID=38269 /ORGANISM="Gloeochaete witrockiana, Strain SAG 46.84" /LENGTH=521 /DNA_ID=CAMNT_0027088485 /DNA_START=120 /DNA_END=1685 /DNA_ORIENTATION=+
MTDAENGALELLLDGAVVSRVPLDSEESFTLETFGSLIHSHWRVGKSFIVAQVATRDKDLSSKLRYSYYSAWHINKLLFKHLSGTDGFPELCHRYSRRPIPPVLNPLTNSEIVGEVSYFQVILPPEFSDTIEPSLTDASDTTSLPTLTPTASSTSNDPLISPRLPSAIASPQPSPRSPPASPPYRAPVRYTRLYTPPRPSSSLRGTMVVLPPLSPTPAILSDTEPVTSVIDEPPPSPSEDVGSGVSGAVVESRDVEPTTRPVTLTAVKVEPTDISLTDPTTPFEGSDPQCSLTHLNPDLLASVRLKYEPLAEENIFPALFIGTDYSLAFNESLRQVFALNALEPELADVTSNANGPASVDDVTNMINTVLRRLNPQIAGHNRPQRRRIQRIHVPFARGSIFGSLSALYVVTCCLVTAMSISHVVNSAGSRNNDWYWLFLPFFSFTTDRLVSAMYRKQESRAIMSLKFALWTFYVLFPITCFMRSSQAYSLARDVLDLSCPAIFLFYSVGHYMYHRQHKRLV